jgi:predicted RNA-binding protein with PIN domain
MHLIVDAFNVLHCWGGGPEPGGFAELESLAGLIGRSRFSSGRVSIVCDGRRFRDRSPSIPAPSKIIFAGAGKDADDLIESLIRRDTGPRELVVASSDRRLQRASRRRGGKWLASPQFLSQLIRDSAEPGSQTLRPAFARKTPLARDAVDHWLDEFDISSDFAGPRSEPMRPAPTRAGHHRPKMERPSPSVPQSTPLHDPLLREAMEHWCDRLAPEDLDMRRWLDDSPGPNRDR